MGEAGFKMFRDEDKDEEEEGPFKMSSRASNHGSGAALRTNAPVSFLNHQRFPHSRVSGVSVLRMEAEEFHFVVMNSGSSLQDHLQQKL